MTIATSRNRADLLNKVPEATLFFWIIKIMATTVGETGADFLSVKLNFGLGGTSLVMSGLLLLALAVQLRSRRYVPSIYWIAVVLVSVVGTLLTDNLTDKFGISLFVTTAVFSTALAATFALWYSSERTVSIHSITTTKRELFYWAAILFTFALGTAAGDLMAEKLALGYGPSALIFGAAIAAVTVACYGFKANAILAFWIAYILTRLLGASVGDLLSQPRADGGLGLGTTGTSALFLVVIVGLVVYLTAGRNRAPDYLAFFAGLYGAALDEAFVARRLKAVGLAPHRGQAIGTFSRGMRQRLGLARALIADPALLVLDEPTAGLDPRGRREIHDLLAGLARQGVGVLLCTHLLDDVERLCARACFIADGRTVAEGRVEDLMRAHGGNQARFRLELSGQLPDPASAPAHVRILARERGGATVTLMVCLMLLLLSANPLLLGASLRQSALGVGFDASNPFSAALNTYDAVVIDGQGAAFQSMHVLVVLVWLCTTAVFAATGFRQLQR